MTDPRAVGTALGLQLGDTDGTIIFNKLGQKDRPAVGSALGCGLSCIWTSAPRRRNEYHTRYEARVIGRLRGQYYNRNYCSSETQSSNKTWAIKKSRGLYCTGDKTVEDIG